MREREDQPTPEAASLDVAELTSLGPATTTWKYLPLPSSGTARIPCTGSATSRAVSCGASHGVSAN